VIGRLIARPEVLSFPLALCAWISMLGEAWSGGTLSCCRSTPTAGDESRGWVLMVIAMMLPTATPVFRSVSNRSYRSRRWRSVVGCMLGYLAVWMAPLPVLLAIRLHPVGTAWWLPTLSCALGAVWALHPARRRWFAKCHREIPLCPVGIGADRDAIKQGVLTATGCVAGCWPLMLACAFTGHDLVMMAGGTALAFHERRAFRYEPTMLVAAASALGLWTCL